ncbi:MAG: helix-hairpin-helix domain-containing protein [Eubacteriaceae bacterium]|jgi:competence protein ComEA
MSGQEQKRKQRGFLDKNKIFLKAAALGLLILIAAGLSMLAGKTEEEPALTDKNSVPAAEEQAEIYVHVAGAVASPGVVVLKDGARIIEAVESAGGLLPEADTENLNFAAVAVDGQKITVPFQGEQDSSVSENAGLVNINTATEKQLQELPGIGEVTAGNIVSWREKNGGFSSKEQIKEVNRIGDKLYEQIENLICI